MYRPLLVSRDPRFVDDVLDGLGDDISLEVTEAPLRERWRSAPLVLVDAAARDVLERLPAHPHAVLVIGPHWVDGFARLLHLGVPVYQWPHATETIRAMIEHAAVSRGPQVRIGVTGGHGGAGASTLAAAFALAAVRAGRITLLRDADPIGGGLRRAAEWTAVQVPGDLRIVDDDRWSAELVATALDRIPAEVAIVDLGRTLDCERLAIAKTCDLVYVLADVERNERATRAVISTLRLAGVVTALAPRGRVGRATALAAQCRVPLTAPVPTDDAAVEADGSLRPDTTGPLAEQAAALLIGVPEFIAEVFAP